VRLRVALDHRPLGSLAHDQRMVRRLLAAQRDYGIDQLFVVFLRPQLRTAAQDVIIIAEPSAARVACATAWDAVRRLCTELRQRGRRWSWRFNGYPLIHAARAVARPASQRRNARRSALAFHSTASDGRQGIAAAIARHARRAGLRPAGLRIRIPIAHWLRRGLRARRNAVIHNGGCAERFAPSVPTRWRTATRAALGFRDEITSWAAVRSCGRRKTTNS